MWILVICIALPLALPIQAQQPSRCVQLFDQSFRQCFRDFGGFELDIVFSLVTNETSGRLPPNLIPQKQNLVSTLCTNRVAITNCITPKVKAADASCQQTEIGMMDGTVNSMVSGLGNLCGVPSQGGSICMKNFDVGFRQCLTTIGINADHFFMMLADQPLPAGVNKDQLKQKSCTATIKSNLMQCATQVLGKIQGDCKPQETIMVGTTLQNMMGAFEGVCTGKPTNPDQCMSAFEDGMNTCAQKTLNMDMKVVLMVLNGQSLQPGQDAATLKKSICGQWHNLENCGKNVVGQTAGECARPQMLMVEATFANMMITTATFCGDTSLPGACLLTLQKQFGECFGKVGLAPEIYLSNATDHKGALIGANTAEAKEYCSKKHDLFTCMQEVIHKCPGAEQTLSLTGFDLHGMERAVGILCHDIPDYLAGLKCFEQPTDSARGCMEEMTMAITDLSTKQITQKLNMDTFFSDFCTARVKHVACDSKAWPACQKSAIDLKNQFECQLIPSKCYNSHKDNIDTICPNTDIYIPDTDTNIKNTALPPCAQNIQATMNRCFSQFGMDPDMFLVNITHDRSNFMGDKAKAESLCRSKDDIFRCMTNALDSCPAAKDILSFWGHQQSSLVTAVNVICNNLPTYGKGVSCFANGNAQVQQCISNTESKMMNLADKQVSKKLSPDSYFRDFCSIRIEHLRCDLNGWRQSCGVDVVGLKTEYECKLIQQHCKNLQVGNYKAICNENAYQFAARGGSGSGVAGNTGSNTGSADSSCSTVTASLLSLVGSVIASIVLFVL